MVSPSPDHRLTPLPVGPAPHPRPFQLPWLCWLIGLGPGNSGLAVNEWFIDGLLVAIQLSVVNISEEVNQRVY